MPRTRSAQEKSGFAGNTKIPKTARWGAGDRRGLQDRKPIENGLILAHGEGFRVDGGAADPEVSVSNPAGIPYSIVHPDTSLFRRIFDAFLHETWPEGSAILN